MKRKVLFLHPQASAAGMQGPGCQRAALFRIHFQIGCHTLNGTGERLTFAQV